MLPKEAVTEFAELYLKNFGIQLTQEEAVEKATRVFNFFKTIIRPVEESTKLADEIPGQESEAERKNITYGDKKKSKKS
ncbi:MAG: hypothetical protein ACD_22C00128G0002 [uncultured bacterium]|nr:MAG: hypothetical protein ACD_22C00128G0002 [uncultured bacterium]